MTGTKSTTSIQIDANNIIDGAGTITPPKNECQNAAMLNRLVLWLEKEAHLHGVDIEVEVAGILAKLRAKGKP